MNPKKEEPPKKEKKADEDPTSDDFAEQITKDLETTGKDDKNKT